VHNSEFQYPTIEMSAFDAEADILHDV
jgi:hypothetical protein